MAKRPPREGEGRPSKYTKELGDAVCKKIGEGLSMRTVCAPDEMPDMSTVFRWIREDAEYCKQYVRATEERTESQSEALLEMGEEAIEKAQDVDPKAAGAVVQAYKLKADNLKWSMSKMKPKKYGDKLDLTSGGEKLPQPIINVHSDSGTKEGNEPQ